MIFVFVLLMFTVYIMYKFIKFSLFFSCYFCFIVNLFYMTEIKTKRNEITSPGKEQYSCLAPLKFLIIPDCSLGRIGTSSTGKIFLTSFMTSCVPDLFRYEQCGLKSRPPSCSIANTVIKKKKLECGDLVFKK